MKIQYIIIPAICLLTLTVGVSEHLTDSAQKHVSYTATTTMRTEPLETRLPTVYTVPQKDDIEERPSIIDNPPFFTPSVLLNSDILAFYGSPRSKRMGILGRYTLPQLEPILLDYVGRYKKAASGRDIIPALYIIYATCWPEGRLGYLSESTIKKYIDYAAERGWYVFLDHQIGRYSVEESVKEMLPYLHYQNVHLAIDPEWRTTLPMEEIGSVTGSEVNNAQQIIEDYMESQGLPGSRMLVIHQFKPSMITSRSNVKSDFAKVHLIHVADGFGNPAIKRLAYRDNAKADNIPLKGFKLFFHSGYDFAGYDDPLMTPEDVYELDPRPYLIMYQ